MRWFFYVFPAVWGLNCPVARDGARVEQYMPESKCVYIYDNTLFNWIDAEKECQKIQMGELGGHGDLVTVHSFEFDDWLFKTLASAGNYYRSYWLGLRSLCPTCPLEWNDLHPFNYENWQAGEPNGIGVENCVEMHTAMGWPDDPNVAGLWNDLSCDTMLYGICQFYPEGDPYAYTKEWPTMGGCPEGWLQYAGACYMIPIQGNGVNEGKQLLIFDMAEKDCADRGPDGHLAIITNRFQQAFIASMMYKTNLWSRPYIGVMGSANDHYFYYVDNSRLVYSNWGANNPGQPIEDRRCVVMDWHPGDRDEAIGQWADSDCTTHRPWVCTMPVQASLSPQPLPNNEGNCPDDWVPFAQFCYKYVSAQSNYNGAEQTCASMQSQFPDGKVTVASVIDPYENEFVLSFLGSDFTNRMPPQTVWLGMHAGLNGEITWSDEHHFDYTAWGPNQPSNDPTEVNGVMNNLGLWFLYADQGTSLSYVCKANPTYRKEIEAHDYRGNLTKCSTHHWGGDDWSEYKEYCMRGFSEAKTWAEAEDVCKKQDVPSNLVSIHDRAMNEYVFSKVVRISKDQAWIGMSKHGESQGWKWADNSAVEFTHWATGEPSPSLVGTEDCVEMNQNGNWNNRDCSRQGMPFVCSHPRPWSNCMLAEIEKTPCGYPGIAEQECMDTWKCCYNANSDINCFIPAGSDVPNHGPSDPGSSGMTNAGAVCLTLFIFILLPIGYFGFSRYCMSGTSPWSTGFSNPSAT